MWVPKVGERVEFSGVMEVKSVQCGEDGWQVGGWIQVNPGTRLYVAGMPLVCVSPVVEPTMDLQTAIEDNAT